ncbi:MAG TPA: xanthine dehydrogenase [Planctomycetes bacterium]|nr:xanthine dehydrogenase [Planctomycetota bacterium]HIN80892.1 xanthine dehydrogenase [Planctomycetota bacterium]
MIEIFQEAARILESGGRAALATIIGTTGSTPGKIGARLLVRDDGSTLGTVGGGCTEADIWRAALEVIASGESCRKRFRLTAATAAETGLLCGGEFEVYIEPIGNPSVVILGAGHLARALVVVLNTLEYRTTVIDDRETFASLEFFPGASEVLVRDFSNPFEGLEITPNSCVIIVTRGHEHDESALESSLETAAGYIGLIGSKGKIGAIFKNLRDRGVEPEKLDRVRAPIGLPIGSRTPEEIAVAICAQLIAHRRSRTLSPEEKAGEPLREGEARGHLASPEGGR